VGLRRCAAIRNRNHAIARGDPPHATRGSFVAISLFAQVGIE
jgi:hypothetical protein